jgi:hypothetical protein
MSEIKLCFGFGLESTPCVDSFPPRKNSCSFNSLLGHFSYIFPLYLEVFVWFWFWFGSYCFSSFFSLFNCLYFFLRLCNLFCCVLRFSLIFSIMSDPRSRLKLFALRCASICAHECGKRAMHRSFCYSTTVIDSMSSCLLKLSRNEW